MSIKIHKITKLLKFWYFNVQYNVDISSCYLHIIWINSDVQFISSWARGRQVWVPAPCAAPSYNMALSMSASFVSST